MNNYRTALDMLTDERISQDAEEIETTLERIQALRDEAAAASDADQAALCDRALSGDVAAYLECLGALVEVVS